MGEVYKAFDTQRDRYVALKLLPAVLSADREYFSRFQRESYVIARLRDPHIIPIHDFGEIEGHLYIDMRLVDGTDVASLLQTNGPLTPERASYIVGQVAEALDAAHADHLVHRDIKPSNILVTPRDFVYVVDFGIARSMGSTQQTALTVTGATVGTLNYMAPERFVGQDIDGRADVYSLACVLHECLTGASPFAGKDLPSLIYAHLYAGVPRASELVPGVPPALDDVIACGMAKAPDDRYPSAGALAAAVREALLTGTAPPMSAPRSGGGSGVPASTWVSATEAWQGRGTGPRPEREPAPPPTPTQTVLSSSGGTRPPQNQYPTVVPEPDPAPGPASDPDGGGLPPDAAAGRPYREPGRRRRGALVAASAAVAAAAIVVIVLALTRSHPGTASPAANAGATSAAATSSGSAGPPAVALPTFAGRVGVGESPSYAEVAPDGKFAYVTDNGKDQIAVLDTATDKVTKTIPIAAGPPQFVSFSGDGKTAFVSVYSTRGTKHAVVFIDTATGAVTGTVPVNNHEPGPAEAGPDGRYLYVPNHNMSMPGQPGDNLIDVIDTSTRKLVDSIPVAANPHWVVFGQNGLLYATNHMSGTVTVVNSSNNKVVTKFVVGETPHAEDISPDKSHLAVTSWSGNEVFIVDIGREKTVATIAVGRNPLDISYSPDGRFVYTANNEDDTVSVIDTAGNRVVGTIPTGKSPSSITVLPNGRQAYVTDEGDGTLEILNLPQ